MPDSRWYIFPSAGCPIQDGTFFLLLNAHHEPVPFVLPGLRNVEWQLVVDTAREPAFARSGEAYGSAAAYDLRDRSIVLLQLKAGSTRALQRTRRGQRVITAKRAHRTPRIGERNPRVRRDLKMARWRTRVQRWGFRR
jgi:hypothetical protein